MSKRGRDLTSDEQELWCGVTARVKPRRKASAVTTPAPPPSPPAPPRKPTAAFLATTPRPSESPLQDRGGEKRVRRGKVEIGASLDLHGHTQDSARAALIRFLRAAHKRGDRAVIVVTGAGRAGEGVLKRRLPEWLADHDVRPLVAGFAQAHRAHGGAGAFYVFLKLAASKRA